MDAPHPHTLLLIRKLESITTLFGGVRVALLRLPMRDILSAPDPDEGGVRTP